ncbi:MAG TPA: aryl-sulfate sulfotransferase [Ignavibacteriaceae bacterium]|nr:aryl-sulfate sulfotransferase [Ignavibacteriaceae bacterium]
MKNFSILVLLFLSAAVVSNAQSGSYNIDKFQYLLPKPGSQFVNPGNDIVIRQGNVLQNVGISVGSNIEVTGSLSGNHEGRFYLSDDNKTLVFLPAVPFSLGETVTVKLNEGLKTDSGNPVPPLKFNFFITKTAPLETGTNGVNISKAVVSNIAPFTVMSTNNLPADFPEFKIDTVNNPAPGNIFFANKPAAFGLTYGYYLIIADNNGNVVKYAKFNSPESNFRVLPNGELMTSENGRHIILASTLAPVDTFKCGNGYTADSHDFLLLPNGHALLFATDRQPVDMSKIISGGRPDAIVTGAVIQELDASKNVIFQWRTFDYIPITNSYFDLTQKSIPYVHGNALDVDNDGNILFSLRYCSAIVKINRKTGDLEWTLGGKANQFKFYGEHSENAPTYFSNQHNILVLPQEHVLLFDNGDQHPDHYSRGVEYVLDEADTSATMVWEFDHGRKIYTSSGGSVQRLPNGNTIVGWSRPPSDTTIYHPIFTEVNDTTIVQEYSFKATNKMFSYRVYKYPWPALQPEYSYTLYSPVGGNTYPNPANINDTAKIGIHTYFQALSPGGYSEYYVRRYNYSPMSPTFNTDAPVVFPHYFNIDYDGGITSYGGKLIIELKYFPDITDSSGVVVYARPKTSGDFVPLATSFNGNYPNLGRVLIADVADNKGDFLFGMPRSVDSAYVPVPFSPSDSLYVDGTKPVDFSWGVKGIIASSRLQIATDAAFTNLVKDTSMVGATNFTDSTLSNDTHYYWRVNITNSKGTSDWSSTMKVFTTSPFLNMKYPNGGETVLTDTTLIIRWDDNVNDNVNINLYYKDTLYTTIDTSIASATNAYGWLVPDSLKEGDGYKILVSSTADTNLHSMSANTFKIDNPTGIDDFKTTLPVEYSLKQNYPNPFNPTTIIQYSIPNRSMVTLKVYDLLGREVQTLVNEEKPVGNYRVNFNASSLASGVYFYRITAGSFNMTRKLIVLK